MTIDEGIKNLEYGTEQLEMEIESGLWIKGSESELCCKEGIALNKQYIEWLKELKEAKRLLKLAVEDLSCGGENSKCTKSCKTCTHNSIKGHGCRYYGEYHWRYTDKALKLIEEEAP